jgi:hypothetical protein
VAREIGYECKSHHLRYHPAGRRAKPRCLHDPRGRGPHRQIVIASAKAYVKACTKILQPSARARLQTGDV